MAPPTEQPGRESNHLLGQTSPYLIQHLHNPVDWYPWGAEALQKAAREDKPIFLSIGYAACHWCHVMERESFEDPEVAAFLNAHFVPIKVDREERPDLDEIYMNAVQMLTGSGGWPLNVFLTPDGRPFFGGTYFPPEGRSGRPGFLGLLRKIEEAWRTRREDIDGSAAEITAHLREFSARSAASTGRHRVGRTEIARAVADLSRRFDDTWGGFGQAPKFPPHGSLRLLLNEHARSGEGEPLRMVKTTLDRMALGGMYDQIGGGFARYSTDPRWLVPHFEKMLYDQALLVPVYVDAWLVTRQPLYRRVVEETLDFVRTEMTGPRGEFWSSLDADSEGEEGKFYVWTPAEAKAVLGEQDGAFFCRVYGITEAGNFEGASIANLLGGSLEDLARADGLPEEDLLGRLVPLRARLRQARESRVHPGTDDKVLTAWNGLMITAYARAYQAFGRPDDLESARRAADFVLAELMRDGRLLVSWREGRADLNAYLDDHAFLARGLLDLYEAGFDRRDLDAAVSIARTMIERFGDPERGGFYFTSNDHEDLLTRTRSVYDGALPAGSGVAAEVLLRLALHRGDEELRRAALAALSALRGAVERAPSAFASLLVAADFAEGPVREIAVVGPRDDVRTRGLLTVVRNRFLPNRVLAMAEPGDRVDDLPLLSGKRTLGGRPTAYVCRDYVCQAPVFDPAGLEASLAR